MEEKRKKFFSDVYRIWKVGETAAEKILFLKETESIDFSTESDDEDENLRDAEDLFLYHNGVINISGEEVEGAKWPTPHRIFIEKFYWEHGVSMYGEARLRYFRSHYPEHFELNKTEGLSDERILDDCELAFIVYMHETEIDPEVQFH